MKSYPPGTKLTSIFEGQHPQNNAELPIKTRGPIWVLGSYTGTIINQYNSNKNNTKLSWWECLNYFNLDVYSHMECFLFAVCIFQHVLCNDHRTIGIIVGRVIRVDVEQHWAFNCSPSKGGTVDGWNPAPQRMMIIPLFIGFQPSQVVQDFFHQQYQGWLLCFKFMHCFSRFMTYQGWLL